MKIPKNKPPINKTHSLSSLMLFFLCFASFTKKSVTPYDIYVTTTVGTTAALKTAYIAGSFQQTQVYIGNTITI